MTILYKITDTIFIYCYSYINLKYPKKSLLFVLYFGYIFIDIAFCEYDVEYYNNSDTVPDRQKKYTFSQLNNDFTEEPEQETFFENLTPQQKKLLLCTLIFGVCVVSLWIMMNSENNDLQKRVAVLEKQTKDINRLLAEATLKPADNQPSYIEQEWQRPANWQFGFGF